MVSEFTEQDYAVINEAYDDLKASSLKRCSNEQELEVVQKAFEFANNAHKNVRRRSGEPYMLHPIAVAKIVVSDIGLGYKSIAAALLHDVVEDTDYTIDDLRNLFGDKIASLVDGLTKIKTVLDKEDQAKTQSIQAENFKRILLTLNDDIRVVLIKLADRLHNCRTIEFMPEYKRDKILSETMFIFIPLAHRLGLYSIKSELEDIWLRYKEPDAYKEISEHVDKDANAKAQELQEFMEPIESALKQAGFSFEIKKRVKTPYSIWHKIQTKGVTIDQIYDLYAVRIIFNPEATSVTGNYKEDERAQCYHIFALITSIYKYKADRVRDWVESPKNNGYEALHVTVMSNTGIWVEVQIRSQRMNDIAEKGIAAHWAYKKNGVSENNSESEMELWINKIKSILVNPDVSSLELLDMIHNDLTTTDIFVFTPKGEQRRIQKGATALDFAYMIHTHVGNQAIAAKVNMKLVALSYVLRTGDQVEIITAGDGIPKKEWLDFLITHKARNVVSNYYRDVNAGKDSMSQDFEEKPTDKQKSTWNLFGLLSKANRKAPFVINRDNIDKVVISKCCHPIPGDSVVGFVAEDGKVIIHKKTCPEANRLASKYGDNIVIPEWEAIEEKSFDVKLSLSGLDRIGILNEITRYISLVLSMNIREFSLHTDTGVFDGYLVLSVHDTEELDKLIKRLSRIEGLKKVVRNDL
ncbi:MAG: bifunctional (p)ppGpp synthetase/guanosine-3',5'-bis(diphosphate) 3'-pyrophosphohydrolase [Bacteroidales bacterium]|nr:bifunctional (p)ppGpp synthetase/guanosine-3',5'-bis(diphosphate) 3'-pyrophosphohydrolase [Candidatus Cryptobacteroides caccocaballi]